ncbi:Parafibromin [Halotydeus destructor]|nr:Parafibromin [Halotydeus destructor]
MADPLSLLRQYNVSKREITERGNMVCFGEYCWPKTTNTSYLVYGSTRDGPGKEYYSLECLLFLLKNVSLTHPIYVKQAAIEHVPAVRRPDRRELLDYLSGEKATSQSIDKSAPIELPVPVSEVLKTLGDSEKEEKYSKTALSGISDDGPTPAKIRSENDVQKERELFAKGLEERGRLRKVPLVSAGQVAGLDQTSASSLSSAMSKEQIEALKAKRLAKKRSTIIDAENDVDMADEPVTSGPRILLQYDHEMTKEILAKERLWRNRSSVLQSTGKNFGKSIIPMLQSIKMREDGHKKPSNAPSVPPPTRPLTTPAMQKDAGPQQYNRYDQERFSKADVGFKIDTTGTYHGLTLKSVTEGPASATKPSAPTPKTSPHVTPSSSPGTPKKRTSRTPIIIIPATTTSLVTMFNAKSILQDLRFIDGTTSHDGKRESEIHVLRRKPDNTTVPYRVIDNPLKLQPEDWERVVAVFVQGPAWQFKGWPWDGNPVEIFSRIKAFHLKWDEMKLDANVSKWSVDIIELSKTKRHLDRANLLKLWGSLDSYMVKHKHFLRF